jgi:hypothetical protein
VFAFGILAQGLEALFLTENGPDDLRELTTIDAAHARQAEDSHQDSEQQRGLGPQGNRSLRWQIRRDVVCGMVAFGSAGDVNAGETDPRGVRFSGGRAR